MKYTISSYSKEPSSILGHIQSTQDTNDLAEAKKIASKRVRQGDINVWILEDGKRYMQYANIEYPDKNNSLGW